MKKQFFTLTEDEILDLVDRISKKLKASYEEEQMQKTTTDELLTIEEASKLIKLQKSTIYGLVHKNEIPFSKRGKRLYFNKSELLDWISEGKKETKSSMEKRAAQYLFENKL